MGWWDDIILGASDRMTDVARQSSEYQKGNRGIGEQVAMGAGNAIGGVLDIPGSIIASGVGAIMPDVVKQGFAAMVQGVMDTDAAKAAQKWAKENPREWDLIKNLSSVAGETTAARMLSSGKPELRGMAMSTPENYIDDWYGIATDSVPTQVEAPLVKAINKVRPDLTAHQSLALLRKGKGVAQWAARAVPRAALNKLSPTARATYRSQGVTPTTQKIIKGHLENAADPRGKDKAVAQANYATHIPVQAGRVGPTNPALGEVNAASNLTSYEDLVPGSMAKHMQDNAGTRVLAERTEPGKIYAKGKKKGTRGPDKVIRETEPMVLSEADAAYAERHVLRANDGADKYVMKAPSGAAGNHYNDVLYNNPAIEDLSEIMLGNHGGDVVSIYRELLKREPHQTTANEWIVKNTSVEDVAKNGLWLTGGKTGGAITEGGVNWLMKVNPDGTVMAFMSDKHDFAEKIMAKLKVDKVYKKAMPNDLIAVTPPMYGNVADIKNRQWAEKGRKAPAAAPKVQRAGTKRVGSVKESLEAIIGAKPTNPALRKEWLKQAAAIKLATGGNDGGPE